MKNTRIQYSLFDVDVLGSCTSYNCYSNFNNKAETEKNIHAKVTSADGSNLEPLGMILHSATLGSCVFHYHFIV